MDNKNFYSAIAEKNTYGINLISKEEILEVVSVRRGIPPQIITSITRKREVVESRQICMVMAKLFRTDSLATIGKFYGNKDHATVLHANKTINNLVDTDKKMKGFIRMIEEDLCIKINEKEEGKRNEEVYLCSECHSMDVKVKRWTDANTGKFSTHEGIDGSDTWCCNCKKHDILMAVKKCDLENYPIKE